MEPSKFTTNKITRVLIYVVLEWTLIFLLLLNSLISYFILKFALYFRLKPPCLLCSRLDHLLDSQKNKKNNFSSYTKFFCEQHASEISNIGYCSNHRKLLESKIVCDDCSSSSSLQQDASLFKWMKEIGIVEEIEDYTMKCSCCDVIINSRKVSTSPYVDFMANLISERELNGCFPNQEDENLVINQRDLVCFDKVDSGYQVLDDVDDEEEEEEKEEKEDELEPLLSTIDDNNINIINDNNYNNMVPKHLEFYIDHDDYRLIPVERKNNLDEDEKNDEILEEVIISREDDDLVFEGDELRAYGEVIIGNTNLPSIQEEEEEEEEDESTTVGRGQGEERPAAEEEEEEEPPAVYNEDMESHLRRDEIATEKNDIFTEDGVCEVYTNSIQLPCTPENDAEGSLNVSDTPNSTESLNLHKKLMLVGRRGSITEESIDGSIISENEVGDNGGTSMEKLKLELQSERKTLKALYAELEEERNASAIAANQTLAMINRLQEEKATMQMEALQYQRMMEEQAEYDQEALQMMNELMVKREKEKQELEKELEVYRKKLVDFEEREKVRILSRRMEGSMRSRNSSASCSYGEESDGLSIDLNHEVIKDHEEESVVISPHCREENGLHDTPSDAVLNLQDSLVGFEDERQSILEQLKVLEEKLFTLAEEEEEEEEEDIEEFHEENGKQQERWLNGSMQKRLLPLFDEVESFDSPNGFDMVGSKSPIIAKFELEKKRLAIEVEVDHVYERLHALEADREFLKHCIGSLKKGDKGLDLLQEILQHLRDLKNVELQVMKNVDPCASI